MIRGNEEDEKVLILKKKHAGSMEENQGGEKLDL